MDIKVVSHRHVFGHNLSIKKVADVYVVCRDGLLEDGFFTREEAMQYIDETIKRCEKEVSELIHIITKAAID